MNILMEVGEIVMNKEELIPQDVTTKEDKLRGKNSAFPRPSVIICDDPIQEKPSQESKGMFNKLKAGEKLTVSLVGIEPEYAKRIRAAALVDWLNANGYMNQTELLLTADKMAEKGQWIWKPYESKDEQGNKTTTQRIIQFTWEEEPVIFFTYT